MNILITGAKSFVGKRLIEVLKKKKSFKIIGCDLIGDKKNKVLKIDIRKKNFYKSIKAKVDVIIHLAAISRDKDCEKDLSECYNTNIIGTLNVIKAAEKLSVKKVIFASTEWVYHNSLAANGANENSILNLKKLKSNYAKSKLLGEYFLRDFYNKFNIDISILRFGIIYGERRNNWSAVETLFNSIRNNDVIKVGSLKTARKFIHIEDICYGIFKSLRLKKFNIVNLQGKKLITLEEIISTSEKILEKKTKRIETNPQKPSIRNIKSKISFKEISFTPKIDLNNGLIKLKKFLNF